MRIFALELNNDIKGIDQRKEYIESLIADLPSPDFVVLPELALSSYMASQEIWQYADDCSSDTSAWAMSMGKKYNTLMGVGYLDKENGDYFNRYLIADADRVYGVVTKSEGEAAVFKRGLFDCIIKTPIGHVGVAICYDSKRKHFYECVKDAELSMILFPHGSPAQPEKIEAEQKLNDYCCGVYAQAFDVPVVYVNSKGALEYMPGKMGQLMAKAGFKMNGLSKIYGSSMQSIFCDLEEALGAEVTLASNKRSKDIQFYGDDLIKGNWFFRKFILKPDIQKGLQMYEENR